MNKFMKCLLLTMTIIFAGCGGGGSSDGIAISDAFAPYIEPTTGNVREYNAFNSDNKVNVFISIGQSNARGVTTLTDMNLSNVLMPEESIELYPGEITLIQASRIGINKAIQETAFINTATKFALDYNSSIPLIVINIAVGGTGLNTTSRSTNLWSATRADNDGKSLHPQTIRYLETLFNQLQDDGLEPFVIAMDWNQWESEKPDTAFAYFDRYSSFFETFETVIPNRDFKLFICNPTSTYFAHREIIAQGFDLIKGSRGNTFIYNPLSFGVDVWRDEIEVHYTEELHYEFANYILDNI